MLVIFSSYKVINIYIKVIRKQQKKAKTAYYLFSKLFFYNLHLFAAGVHINTRPTGEVRHRGVSGETILSA